MPIDELYPDPSRFNRFLENWFGNDNADLSVAPTTGTGSASEYIDNSAVGDNFIYSPSTDNGIYGTSGDIVFDELKYHQALSFFITSRSLTGSPPPFSADLWIFQSDNPSVELPQEHTRIAGMGLEFNSLSSNTEFEEIEYDFSFDNTKTGIFNWGQLFPRLIFQTPYNTFSQASGIQINHMRLVTSGESPEETPWNFGFLKFFIQAEAPATGHLDLYTFSSSQTSSGIPLYIEGGEQSSSGLPLFIEGSGISEPTANSGNLDLYIQGGYTSSSGFPMFVEGLDVGQSGINFYLLNIGNESGNLPLTIKGHLPDSSGFPLYIRGSAISTGGINFNMSGWGEVASTGVPFSLWATTNPGQFDTMPFVLEAGDLDNRNAIPFYTSGPTSASLSTYINFSVYNDNSIDNGLSFFLGNYFTNTSGGVPFYIMTPSGTEGAVPINASMNMFMARDSEGVARGIPFTISGPVQLNEGVPFYVEGGYSGMNDNVNFYMSGIGQGTNSIQFYTQGF